MMGGGQAGSELRAPAPHGHQEQLTPRQCPALLSSSGSGEWSAAPFVSKAGGNREVGTGRKCRDSENVQISSPDLSSVVRGQISSRLSLNPSGGRELAP